MCFATKWYQLIGHIRLFIKSTSSKRLPFSWLDALTPPVTTRWSLWQHFMFNIIFHGLSDFYLTQYLNIITLKRPPCGISRLFVVMTADLALMIHGGHFKLPREIFTWQPMFFLDDGARCIDCVWWLISIDQLWRKALNECMQASKDQSIIGAYPIYLDLTLNSLWPSDACMILAHIMACRLFGAKPSSGLEPWGHISVKFE